MTVPLGFFEGLTGLLEGAARSAPVPNGAVDDGEARIETVLGDPAWARLLTSLQGAVSLAAHPVAGPHMQREARAAFAARLRHLTIWLAVANRLESTGTPTTAAARLREHIARTVDQAHGYLDHWPHFDALTTELARAEVTLGRTVPVEDACAELLGTDAARLRERAAGPCRRADSDGR